jgi:hypothetical protein
MHGRLGKEKAPPRGHGAEPFLVKQDLLYRNYQTLIDLQLEYAIVMFQAAGRTLTGLASLWKSVTDWDRINVARGSLVITIGFDEVLEEGAPIVAGSFSHAHCSYRNPVCAFGVALRRTLATRAREGKRSVDRGDR